MTRSVRLVLPSDIPQSLWYAGCLLLPAGLAQAYKHVVVDCGLQDVADLTDTGDGPVGGLAKEDADKHFASRFGASVARVQLAVLDPKDELKNAADFFAAGFAGNKLAILDLPFGAGAGSLALLSILADLRRERVVPREPLDVLVMGGDISSHSLAYATQLFAAMRVEWEQQGIFVEARTITWDVTCPQSTTGLIDWWVRNGHAHSIKRLLFANFSGFLQQKKFRAAEPQLQNLFRFANVENAEAVWIEPQTNEAVGATSGLLPRIAKMCVDKLKGAFAARRTHPDGADYARSNAIYRHPLVPDRRPSVHLAVMRLDRGGTP